MSLRKGLSSLAKFVAVTASLGACTSVPRNPYFTPEGTAFRDNVTYLSCLRGITDTRAAIKQNGLDLRVKEVGKVDKTSNLEDITATNIIVEGINRDLEAAYGKDAPKVIICKRQSYPNRG